MVYPIEQRCFHIKLDKDGNRIAPGAPQSSIYKIHTCIYSVNAAGQLRYGATTWKRVKPTPPKLVKKVEKTSALTKTVTALARYRKTSMQRSRNLRATSIGSNSWVKKAHYATALNRLKKQAVVVNLINTSRLSLWGDLYLDTELIEHSIISKFLEDYGWFWDRKAAHVVPRCYDAWCRGKIASVESPSSDYFSCFVGVVVVMAILCAACWLQCLLLKEAAFSVSIGAETGRYYPNYPGYFNPTIYSNRSYHRSDDFEIELGW
jgi:hypothetical protein